jgi:hypothetical protein
LFYLNALLVPETVTVKPTLTLTVTAMPTETRWDFHWEKPTGTPTEKHWSWGLSWHWVKVTANYWVKPNSMVKVTANYWVKPKMTGLSRLRIHRNSNLLFVLPSFHHSAYRFHYGRGCCHHPSYQYTLKRPRHCNNMQLHSMCCPTLNIAAHLKM